MNSIDKQIIESANQWEKHKLEETSRLTERSQDLEDKRKRAVGRFFKTSINFIGVSILLGSLGFGVFSWVESSKTTAHEQIMERSAASAKSNKARDERTMDLEEEQRETLLAKQEYADKELARQDKLEEDKRGKRLARDAAFVECVNAIGLERCDVVREQPEVKSVEIPSGKTTKQK